MVLKNKDGETRLADKSESTTLDYLGIELVNLKKAELKDAGVDNGVKVESITSGIIKRQTNMKAGFIITNINGEPVKDVEDFSRIMNKSKGGVMLEGVYQSIPGRHYYAFGIS